METIQAEKIIEKLKKENKELLDLLFIIENIINANTDDATYKPTTYYNALLKILRLIQNSK